MARIEINSQVINSVNSDNLITLLNNMLDAELSKSEDEINADFVDDCVDALIMLEQEADNFTALVPLVSSEKFLKKLTEDNHSAFKSLNIFARTAIIAALIAGSTLTANAAVEAVTGVNVLKTVGTKVQTQLETWGLIDFEGIEYIEGEDDDDDIITSPATTTIKEIEEVISTSITATPATQSTTRFEGVEYIDGVDDDDDETTTTTKPTTQFEGIEYIDGVDDDDDDEATTSTTQKATTEPTTKELVTSPPPVTTKKNDAVSLLSIVADASDFKQNYIYGEQFTTDGLKLYANYSDGSKKEISLDDCYYTKLYETDVTADYTFIVTYKSCKLELNITYRPDEETRGAEICSNADFDYLLTSRGAYITAYKGSASEVALDETDGYNIYAICAGAFDDCGVEKITSNNVRKLFKNAFKNSETLKTVSLFGVKHLGDSAFDGCINMTDFADTSAVTYLGEAAFRKTAIKNITIPDSIVEIPDYLFDTCHELKSVVFNGRVTKIGTKAFASCEALESVTGCTALREVGNYAFYSDEKVDFDIFPESIEYVGNYAFYLCQALDIGSLPKSIKHIGKSAFAYCTLLTSLKIPDGITVIPYEAFRGVGAKTVTIPEGVTVIEDYALRATKATKLTLPSSLEELGIQSIYSPLLREIRFNSSPTAFADDAIYASRSVTLYV